MRQQITGHLRCRNRGVDSCQIADLFGDNRTDSGKTVVDRFSDRHWFGEKFLCEIFLRYAKWILFFHSIRDKIFSSRKNLTHRTHLRGNMLDTVDDHSFFITENNIAVLAHDLNDQGFAAQISKFIQVLDLEADDPFQGRLRNAYDAAICNMFSQKHTEIRRSHWTWFVISGEIDQRQGCTCGDDQSYLSFRRFDREKQFIIFRLCDLGDPPVQDGII